jgi:hypothetical protein
MEFLSVFGGKKAASQAEERAWATEHVREQVAAGVAEHEAAQTFVTTYKEAPRHEVLAPGYALSDEHIAQQASALAPEATDAQVRELVRLTEEKGIKNAIAVAEALKSPRAEDDFHSYLVQYVKAGLAVKGLEKGPLWKGVHMTLYEVVLPERADADKGKSLKELVSSMEQFYSGMLSVSGKENPHENSIVLEIANSDGSEEFVFYAAVPDEKTHLFEKHIMSVFSTARITPLPEDYNIFNTNGGVAAAQAVPAGNPIYPIRTYEEFDMDPLNGILGAFSKLTRDGEGAGFQVVITPSGESYAKKCRKALEDIKAGKPLNEAIDIPMNAMEDVMKDVKSLFAPPKKKDPTARPEPADPALVNLIEQKVGKPIITASMRLVASAADDARAEAILGDLESAFNQLSRPQRSGIEWKRAKGSKRKELVRAYTFRSTSGDSMPLNLAELSTLFHFHTDAVHGMSQLRTAKAGLAPAPMGMPATGTFLGINTYRGIETPAYLTDEDRLRHFYAIGQTGTGKSTLLKNMIIQDIKRGHGVCMIDPHGSDIQDVLAAVPPERAKDVIYFDPGNTARPMALNMLEYDRNFPEQKTFVVNELFAIFQKLYGANPESMGPMFEQYFRNATMLVIEDPDTGSTLLDVSRVLSSKEYRQMKIARCKNPVVVQFWREIAEKAGGEASLANIVPYITSKFDVFLANEIMRPIIAQERSTFDFREIMDGRKILLVNLAKGRLGDINANLIGLILVGKILMAALSRVDSFGKDLPSFFLYIDEFQNITTPSIATILSEARKYKLSLTIAHQFIAQLDERIRDAVFGNVGSLACFRVGADDAEYLEKQFAPVFSAHDIMNIENRNAYLKILVDGRPVKPFNVVMAPPPPRGTGLGAEIIEHSLKMYGRDREEVEREILAKYQ